MQSHARVVVVGLCVNDQGGSYAAASETSMALPDILKDKLRLPVVGAPLFIVSHPALVIAQCKAGIVGAFPALNARPISQLDEWLREITEALAAKRAEQPRHVALTVARGSSDHAASYFASLVMSRIGVPVASLPMSVATLQQAPLRVAGQLAVAF